MQGIFSILLDLHVEEYLGFEVKRNRLHGSPEPKEASHETMRDMSHESS